MNHMLIVIKYHLPGQEPVITSSLVPIDSDSQLFYAKRKELTEQYAAKPHYDITVSKI